MPYAHSLNLEQLSKYFHLPINDVAKELGICATVLKKICRKNGIPRWPHRKIKSLNKMIKILETTVPKTPEDVERINKEIAALQSKKVFLMKNPNVLALKGSKKLDLGTKPYQPLSPPNIAPAPSPNSPSSPNLSPNSSLSPSPSHSSSPVPTSSPPLPASAPYSSRALRTTSGGIPISLLSNSNTPPPTPPPEIPKLPELRFQDGSLEKKLPILEPGMPQLPSISQLLRPSQPPSPVTRNIFSTSPAPSPQTTTQQHWTVPNWLFQDEK